MCHISKAGDQIISSKLDKILKILNTLDKTGVQNSVIEITMNETLKAICECFILGGLIPNF